MLILSLILIFNLNFIYGLDENTTNTLSTGMNSMANILNSINTGQMNEATKIQLASSLKEIESKLKASKVEVSACDKDVPEDEVENLMKDITLNLNKLKLERKENVVTGINGEFNVLLENRHPCTNPLLRAGDDSDEFVDFEKYFNKLYGAKKNKRIYDYISTMNERVYSEKKTLEHFKTEYSNIKSKLLTRIQSVCDLCSSYKATQKALRASGMTGTQIAALVLATGATLTPLMVEEEEEALGKTCSEQCSDYGYTEGTTEWDLCLCASTDPYGNACKDQYACQELEDEMSSCSGQIETLKEADSTCGGQGCDTLLSICKCTEYNHIEGINKEWKNGKCVDVKTDTTTETTYADNTSGSLDSVSSDTTDEEVEEDDDASTDASSLGTGAKTAAKKDSAKDKKSKKDKAKEEDEKHELDNSGGTAFGSKKSYASNAVSSEGLGLTDKKTGKAKDIASVSSEDGIFDMVEKVYKKGIDAGRFMTYSVNSFKKRVKRNKS